MVYKKHHLMTYKIHQQNKTEMVFGRYFKKYGVNFLVEQTVVTSYTK